MDLAVSGRTAASREAEQDEKRNPTHGRASYRDGCLMTSNRVVWGAVGTFGQCGATILVAHRLPWATWDLAPRFAVSKPATAANRPYRKKD